MSESRAAAGMAMTSTGDILITGGLHMALSADLTALDFGLTASSDPYTQGSGSVTAGDMANSRLFPVMVNLPDGTMMIVGGGPLDAEIFQP